MKPTHSMSAMTTASHGVTITLFHPPGFEVHTILWYLLLEILEQFPFNITFKVSKQS